MPVALLGFAIFLAAVAFNFIAAYGIRACAEGRGHSAAMADSALYLIGVGSLAGLLLIGWWVIIPELVGGYLGTYFGTTWRRY